jgi:hypothetical protein
LVSAGLALPDNQTARNRTAENGQIKLLRESLNPVAVSQALLPGGVKDLPDPEKVIFSVPPDYRS